MALHNKNLNYKTMIAAVETYTNVEDVIYNDTELGMFVLFWDLWPWIIALTFDPMIFIIIIHQYTNNKTNNYQLCEYLKWFFFFPDHIKTPFCTAIGKKM